MNRPNIIYCGMHLLQYHTFTVYFLIIIVCIFLSLNWSGSLCFHQLQLIKLCVTAYVYVCEHTYFQLPKCVFCVRPYVVTHDCIEWVMGESASETS